LKARTVILSEAKDLEARSSRQILRSAQNDSIRARLQSLASVAISPPAAKANALPKRRG
jgi:hypothetical protein